MAAAATGRPRRQRRTFGPLLLAVLLLPAVVLFLGAFAYPIGALLGESFLPKGSFGFDNYERIVETPLYLSVLLLTLLIGFPLAYWLTRLRGLAFSLVIACILLPLWTSVLVRSYAWVVLLQPSGLINRTLIDLGIVRFPLPLLYTDGAVLVAMVHVLLPYMVLPIYGALRNIPPNLDRAAQSLGSSFAAEFLTVILPLSRAGVVAGCVMVFVMSIGYFVTPALLGGPRTMMISTLINQQLTSVLNWSFGGALGAVLLATTAVIIVVFNRAMTASRRAQQAIG